jgi:tRNA(Ile)-lysidine synthase
MINRFLNYINQNNLFDASEKVLLTVSGGLDSVVLSHLFYTAKLNFDIAHCNFQLRENDSDQDELFVKNLAEQFNVNFHVVKFDTISFQQANGISIQMAARNLRYDWFRILKQKHHYKCIVTAHHANDQAETVLLNLTAGTGLRGVRGIKPKTNDIVRPLLEFTRKELETYAEMHQLIWREDISNASVKYKRNSIRHLVIPELENINPQFITAVNQFSEKISQVELLLNEQVELWKLKYCKIQNDLVFIDIKSLELIIYKDLILYELIKEFGFDNTVIIFESLQSISGKKFISNTHTLVVDRNQLVISKNDLTENVYHEIAEFQMELLINNTKLTFEIIEDFNFNLIDSNKNIAYLDYSKLTFPLIIRNWVFGDYLKPIGMKGKSKKVSDILIDLKIPINIKDNVLVLECAKELAWLINFRISESFKVEEKCFKVLKISVLNI